MVHSIAVPQTEDRGLCRLMAVARGDGCISIYDADFKPPSAAGAATGASSGSGKKGGSGSKAWQRGSSSGGAQKRQRQQQQTAAAAAVAGLVPGRLALLGQEQGGHTAAVNCVSFLAGSSWQQLLSAGNDCRLLLWNWQVAAAAGREAAEAAAEAREGGDPSSSGGGSAEEGSLRQGGGAQPAAPSAEEAGSSGGGVSGEGSSTPLLAAEVRHIRKINWACSADVAGCGYNAFVADTGRRLTALALARN